MTTQLTAPVNLKCAIVGVCPGVGAPNYEYIVTDEHGIVVAGGVSSSTAWVKHDAGGYHTKKQFDEMFPAGWVVNFDFA